MCRSELKVETGGPFRGYVISASTAITWIVPLPWGLMAAGLVPGGSAYSAPSSSHLSCAHWKEDASGNCLKFTQFCSLQDMLYLNFQHAKPQAECAEHIQTTCGKQCNLLRLHFLGCEQVSKLPDAELNKSKKNERIAENCKGDWRKTKISKNHFRKCGYRDEVVGAVPEVGAVEGGLEGHPHHGAPGDQVAPQPCVPHCRAVCAVCQHRQHAHRLLHSPQTIGICHESGATAAHLG